MNITDFEKFVYIFGAVRYQNDIVGLEEVASSCANLMNFDPRSRVELFCEIFKKLEYNRGLRTETC